MLKPKPEHVDDAKSARSNAIRDAFPKMILADAEYLNNEAFWLLSPREADMLLSRLQANILEMRTRFIILVGGAALDDAYQELMDGDESDPAE